MKHDRGARAYGAIALLAVGAFALAHPAANAVAGASPSPATPGGLAPGESPAAVGDGVHIVKSTSQPSCTGYSSQTAPPTKIRVLVHGSPDKVVTVGFRDYVDNVLPNEWIASWDPASIKAGAIAVKSYAWYWVIHFGGYYQSDGKQTCFDVTDDTNFQVYRPNSSHPRTDDAVAATWDLVAHVGGMVPQTSYRASLTRDPPGPEACGNGANGTTMSQYGSQACAEDGMSFGQILMTYYSGLQLVSSTDSPPAQLVPADFAMTGATTLATFNRGDWSIRGVTGGTYHFGTAGDIPVVSNSGDGVANIGVFRPSNGNWYSHDLHFGGSTTAHWGARGDVPVPANYDGSTEPTVRAVFRPAGGDWYLQHHRGFHFGTHGDIPVPGHYVAGATTDFADRAAVFRPRNGTWYVRGAGSVRWGTRGDIPAPADYNGDGQTDIAVYRPSNHTFYVRESVGLNHSVHTITVRWGTRGDLPVTGDFDGDGRADLAVYRPSTRTWYVRGQPYVNFGRGGALPVESAPFYG